MRLGRARVVPHERAGRPDEVDIHARGDGGGPERASERVGRSNGAITRGEMAATLHFFFRAYEIDERISALFAFAFASRLD